MATSFLPTLFPTIRCWRKGGEPGNLATLLDLDHYREARQPFDIDRVVKTAWTLHDGLDVMFRDVVTSHALEVWSKEP